MVQFSGPRIRRVQESHGFSLPEGRGGGRCGNLCVSLFRTNTRWNITEADGKRSSCERVPGFLLSGIYAFKGLGFMGSGVARDLYNAGFGVIESPGLSDKKISTGVNLITHTRLF